MNFCQRPCSHTHYGYLIRLNLMSCGSRSVHALSVKHDVCCKEKNSVPLYDTFSASRVRFNQRMTVQSNLHTCNAYKCEAESTATHKYKFFTLCETSTH